MPRETSEARAKSRWASSAARATKSLLIRQLYTGRSLRYCGHRDAPLGCAPGRSARCPLFSTTREVFSISRESNLSQLAGLPNFMDAGSPQASDYLLTRARKRAGESAYCPFHPCARSLSVGARYIRRADQPQLFCSSGVDRLVGTDLNHGLRSLTGEGALIGFPGFWWF